MNNIYLVQNYGFASELLVNPSNMRWFLYESMRFKLLLQVSNINTTILIHQRNVRQNKETPLHTH